MCVFFSKIRILVLASPWVVLGALVSSSAEARADVLATLKVEEPGIGAVYRVVRWPSLSDFIVDRDRVNLGTRVVSSPTPLFSISPEGDLIAAEVAPWDPTQIEVYRYRDALDFCQDNNTILGVVANPGNMVGLTFDSEGKVYAIQETPNVGGGWIYNVRRWVDMVSFLTNTSPTTIGTRISTTRQVGVEFMDGKLITLSATDEAGGLVYQVWDWGPSFSGFVQNAGTLVGTHRGGQEIVGLFSGTHSPEVAETSVVRRPLWPWLGNRFPDHTPGSLSGWQAEDAFPNLRFEDPVQMVPQPRSNRLWVIGRQGHVWWFENGANPTSSVLALDLTATTMGGFDGGLLGIAFHPDFGKAGSANRGFVYLWRNFRPEGTEVEHGKSFNRLSRFTLTDGSSALNPASELVLINQYDEHDWHNGGGMFFGADGFLYLTVGDEGGADDVYQNSQRINGGLFGGVLRIDVDRNPARSHPIRRQPQAGGTAPPGWPGTFSRNYWIPNDNPWVDPNGTVLEEFWAVGLRSPHRMSRDAATGAVFIGDIGQAASEEVDLLAKGANYQWAYREGGLIGPKPMPSSLRGADTPPIWSYTREQGDGCVIGGHVYRGAAHAEALGGRYVFGDHASGRIWAMSWQDQPTPVVEQLTSITGYTLAGFGVDHANELYLVTLGHEGRILKLERKSSPQPPATLRATGAFADILTLRPAPGVLPYNVNSPLWSDHAAKQRWIALPNNGAPFDSTERIVFDETNEWQYPEGTVLIKHFELPLNEAQPEVRRRLETRFMVKSRDGDWYGVCYKWRADGSDADLLMDGDSESLTVTTADGSTRMQTWNYPSRNDCTRCHRPETSQVLGLRTWQLNGEYSYPGTGISGNQLRVWSDIGMFDQTLSDAQVIGFLKSASLSDSSASREVRVRSYLDANCAHCHRPGGVPALFDARFSTPLSAQNWINGLLNQELGIPGVHAITPGSTDQSMIHRRMISEEPGLQMPPIGRGIVHQEAVTVLQDWINSLIPPQAPTALVAQNRNYGDLMITWNAQSTNASRFQLQRSLDGLAWATVAEIEPNVMSLTLAGQPHQTQLHFRIVAVNDAGSSAWSAVASVMTWPEVGTLADWQRLHSQLIENAPLQNPDNDSAVNLLEFAFGGDPVTGGMARDGFALVSSGPSSLDAVVKLSPQIKGVAVMLMGASDLTEPMAWIPFAATMESGFLPDGRMEVRVRNITDGAPFSSVGRGLLRVQVRLESTGEMAHTETWFWGLKDYSANTYTHGAAMLRPELFSGTVTTGGGVLGVNGGTDWKTRFDPSRPAYLEVTGGALEGHRFEIDEAAASNGTLVIDTGASTNTASPVPDLSGAPFVVREHWTLGEMFPESRWKSGSNPVRADRIQFYDQAAGNWESYWLVNLSGTPRWVAMGNATLADRSGRVIEPGVGLFIRKAEASRVPFFGVLRPNAYRLRAKAGLSLVAPGFPKDQSPADWQMNTGSGFAASRTPSRADQILRWRGDFVPGASDGYGIHYFLALPSGSFWTPTGNAQIPNDSLSPLFSSQSAVFLKLQSPKTEWVQPRPWTP